jgi:hypothetical protein
MPARASEPLTRALAKESLAAVDALNNEQIEYNPNTHTDTTDAPPMT